MPVIAESSGFVPGKGFKRTRLPGPLPGPLLGDILKQAYPSPPVGEGDPDPG